MDEIDRNLGLLSRALARRRSAENAWETMQTKSVETEPQSIQVELPAKASLPNQVDTAESIPHSINPARFRGAGRKAELVDHQPIPTDVSVVRPEIQEAETVYAVGLSDKGAFIPNPKQDPVPVWRSLWSRLRVALRARR